MRFSVLHSTVYRFDSPVVLEPHVFRLRPREDGAQRLISSQLEISPLPQGQAICLDPEGNVTVQAWFTGRVTELAVRSGFEIETLRANPFDFLLPAPDVLALPPRYGAAERAALAPYLGGDVVREFADSLAGQSGGQTMPFLETLTRTLFETCSHELRPEGDPFPAQETLRARRGSCRDITVLFCAACRAVGIPARFVSGYESQSAFNQEHAYMHAWAEVYVPGGGWRGYDPSRGVAVSTAHVPIAAAADPALAAPMSGSFRGAAAARMEFAISMQVS